MFALGTTAALLVGDAVRAESPRAVPRREIATKTMATAVSANAVRTGLSIWADREAIPAIWGSREIRIHGYAAELMCGICGVVQVSGEPREVVTPAGLDAMTDAMTHRGPNDRGTYSSPGIAVGVRRLSIIDVVGGHQPVFNEDGSVVAVQNGELYNHDEIRKSLRADGHSFASRCDTEILPHLYERDGVAFPVALHGKFGIAVWDERRRRLVLARDRLGVKPLYWAQRGDLVVFASELKSLLASGLVEIELDLEAIDLYFQLGFVPGPRTPLLGVQKLLPGGTLVAGSNDVRAQAYWS